MSRALLEFEGRIGEAAEGNGQPEVDSAECEYSGERLSVSETEAGEHGDEDELHYAEATRSKRYRGQDIGQSIGGKQIDR